MSISLIDSKSISIDNKSFPDQEVGDKDNDNTP